MSGSMSGVWKRSQVRTSEAPPDERGGKQICSGYRYRATPRLYPIRQFASVPTEGRYGVDKGHGGALAVGRHVEAIPPLNRGDPATQYKMPLLY
jgi:hypothetical protein